MSPPTDRLPLSFFGLLLLPPSLPVFKNPSSVLGRPLRLLDDDDRLGLGRADDDRLRDVVVAVDSPSPPPPSVVEEGAGASPPEDIVGSVGWLFFSYGSFGCVSLRDGDECVS